MLDLTPEGGTKLGTTVRPAKGQWTNMSNLGIYIAIKEGTVYVLVRSMVYKKVKITWKLESTYIAIYVYVYTHTYM